jgi:hypothetical protein
LVGIFLCVIHITPQIPHHVSDSHSDESSVQVACIDHQASRACSTEDQVMMVSIAALHPHQTEATQNLFLTSEPHYDTSQYEPYTRERLYIKNNTFLI